VTRKRTQQLATYRPRCCRCGLRSICDLVRASFARRRCWRWQQLVELERTMSSLSVVINVASFGQPTDSIRLWLLRRGFAVSLNELYGTPVLTPVGCSRDVHACNKDVWLGARTWCLQMTIPTHYRVISPFHSTTAAVWIQNHRLYDDFYFKHKKKSLVIIFRVKY